MASAFITGGVKRIGKAIAFLLANQGYDLAIHYNTSMSEAEKIQKEIEKLGRKCLIYKANLTQDQEILGLLPKINQDFPDLEILVNNASNFNPAFIQDTEIEMFNDHFAVNFKTPFFLSRDFARIYKKGHIINLIDTRVVKNDYNFAAYSLAKKALAELTTMSAYEFGPNIRVNAIAPGFILPPEGATPEYLASLKQKNALQKQGKIDQICQGVSYLLANSFVTGQFLFIDGGQNLF